tara:strand:+ start:809 stop:1504 length:696 start_codon:yes stop_codon:yes gene_type:complete
MPSKREKSTHKSSSKSDRKKRSSSSRSKESSSSRHREEARAETAPEMAVEEVVEERPESADTEVRRRRRVVDRDSVLAEFDAILEEFDTEIQNLRSADTKSRRTTGVKFLRTASKRIRTLKNDSARCMKVRKQSTRPRNTTSGFMKPVNISNEMCKFTGWETDCPKSRVDVTKYICNYIKEKELQNPTDRRIILPDSKLKKLLSTENDEDQPLTYYTLQKRIQHHFSKIDQ